MRALLPVIAIVGRPNVGKSTLFNRLTKTRDALISAYPGTTRDRQYGEVKLEQRHFIIIDTGGISEETDDIGKLITQQALQAMQEADKILFVVDARSGILPQDHLIANTLRRLAKPILLAVNKTDGTDPSISVNDAYELGFGKPMGIAAAHGTGISQLLHQLADPIEDNVEGTAQEGIKLAIVGRPNVGKSTLTNRMLGEERVIVHDSPGTTRDSIFIPLERFDKRYTLIDTAGVRKRKKTKEVPEKFSVVKTLQSIENAHVILYVIDARIGVSDQDLKLLGFILTCGKGLVITVNKWDGMTDEDRQHARATLDRQLDFVQFARIHFISALHGSGVGNLFDSVQEAFNCAHQKFSPSTLTKLLEKALLTHSPPLVHGRRVKLRYAHLGGHNPPILVIHGTRVNELPDSYRRFLANFFQTRLKLYGTPLHVRFKASDNPYVE